MTIREFVMLFGFSASALLFLVSFVAFWPDVRPHKPPRVLHPPMLPPVQKSTEPWPAAAREFYRPRHSWRTVGEPTRPVTARDLSSDEDPSPPPMRPKYN